MIVDLKKQLLLIILLFSLTNLRYTTASSVLNFSGICSTNANSISIFDREVRQHDKLVVVKCFMPGCPPCMRMKPIFDKFAQEYGNKIKCIEIDISTCESLANNLRILKIPTFIYFVHGVEKERIMGAQSLIKLKEIAKKYIV